MYKNNFDCSSSGLNIEVSACYDTSYADSIFHDAYCVVYRNGRERSLLIRTYDFEGKCPEKACEVGRFATGKQGPIKKEDIVDILNDCTEYCYDTESYTHRELMDELERIDISQLPDLLEGHGDLFHLNDDLTLYTSTGYCQGDVAYVLCKTETARNYWHDVDHELWDCPVSARVEICGCEYDYYDFNLNQYDFEKEKFIESVVKAHTNDLVLQDKIRKQLYSMLPDELEVV